MYRELLYDSRSLFLRGERLALGDPSLVRRWLSRCALSQANEVALALMLQQCGVERGQPIILAAY